MRTLRTASVILTIIVSLYLIYKYFYLSEKNKPAQPPPPRPSCQGDCQPNIELTENDSDINNLA